MIPKRIAIVALPPLMEELVRRTCGSDPTVLLVERPDETLEAFLHATGRLKVDVVITCADLNSASMSRALLDSDPTVRVLIIERRDGEAMLFELRPFRTLLGPVSPVEILRAVKDDTAHADAWAMLNNGTQASKS